MRLDLSNALPLADNIGALSNIGVIRAAVLKTPDMGSGKGDSSRTVAPAVDEGAIVADTALVLLDEIPYQTPGWLATSGGVAEIPVPAESRELASERPLALIAPNPGSPKSWRILIPEAIGGHFLRAEDFVRRLDARQAKTRRAKDTSTRCASARGRREFR
jgi:hypothetical protein